MKTMTELDVKYLVAWKTAKNVRLSRLILLKSNIPEETPNCLKWEQREFRKTAGPPIDCGYLPVAVKKVIFNFIFKPTNGLAYRISLLGK